MAEKSLTPLKAILETIRERADYALKQLQDAQGERFNALAMQKPQLHEAFYTTRAFRVGSSKLIVWGRTLMHTGSGSAFVPLICTPFPKTRANRVQS